MAARRRLPKGERITPKFRARVR